MAEPKSPTLSEFERRYREEYRPLYEAFVPRLYSLLKELIDNARIPVDHIEYRVKTSESFLEKIERKIYDDPFDQIKDFAGVRIITYYQDDVDRVMQIIDKEFDVDETHSVDKITALGSDEFGYRSVHLIASLSERRATLDEWKRFAGLSAEIQVRSILQHTWAAMSHKLDYKHQSQVPEELRRQLFRLSALLELADEEFTSLRERVKGITEGYRNDVSRGELDLPLNLDSLREFVKQKVDLQKWEAFGVRAGMEPFPQLVSKFHSIGLEILLLTLQKVGISTIAEFESLFPEFEKMMEPLERFVEAVNSKDGTVHAVPVDVLILLVSFSKAISIAPDFDWGGKYESFFIEALREILHNKK